MEDKYAEKEWRALGTDVYLQIVGHDLDDPEIKKIFLSVKEIYHQQESIFSRFSKESELSKINSSLGIFFKASPDMLAVAKKSLAYFKESAGLFDPRILEALEKIGYNRNFSAEDFSSTETMDKLSEKICPEDLEHDLIIENDRIKFQRRMDLSGIAKGYITDRVADFLRLQGLKNFLIDSGGDMFASGKNNQGNPWGIALEGSQNENESLLEISNEAVATSGSVRRNWRKGEKKFHHLINPHQPNNFSFTLRSVTVVEENVEKADVWAKILFLSGLSEGMKKAQEKKIKAFFLKQNKTIMESK